jgi:hypothetical protein
LLKEAIKVELYGPIGIDFIYWHSQEATINGRIFLTFPS